MNQFLQTASEILNQINVPSVPQEVIELRNELNKKYPNTVTVAQLINKNPEMLATFLTLVNTSLTSEKEEIKEVKAAVNIIGLEEIYHIFFSASLSQLITESYQERQILKMGAKSGIAAAELSYWVYDVTRSEAYLAALMQNIGSVYLQKFDPEHYFELFEHQITNPITGYDKEIETYNTSHCFLSAIINKKWHLDSDIYTAILFHHDLDFALKTQGQQKITHLTALIMLSNYIVNIAEDDHYLTQELKNTHHSAQTILNLPTQALQAATAAVKKWGHQAGLSIASH